PTHLSHLLLLHPHDALRYVPSFPTRRSSDLRLEVINDDGRNYLAATQRQYDVIISEPSNPWITGVSDLFTVDHWRITKQRLRPRSEEHTSELQSRENLVCRLLLEKKTKTKIE